MYAVAINRGKIIFKKNPEKGKNMSIRVSKGDIVFFSSRPFPWRF